MTSLRRLLLVSLLTTIGVAAGISTAVSFRASLIETNELFDAKLAQSALVLRALVGHDLDRHSEQPDTVVVQVLELDIEGEGEALATPDGHAYETKLAFQVYTEKQKLLLRSENAPVEPLAPLLRGFGRSEFLDGTWRTFVLRTSNGHYFVLAERDDIRAELAGDIALGTALPPLLFLPVMALLILAIVGWGSRSIARVADQIEQRPANRLDPIDVRVVPLELSGLINALNRLFERVKATIERDQRFTADAAHELRTPISALKLHAQNLAASANATQSAESLQSLMLGIHRCERLVTQLLELARLERNGLVLEARSVDLAVIVRQAIADIAVDAGSRGVEIELRQSGEHRVAGDGVLLAVLARNLIENAVRHGPANALVSVHLDGRDQVVELGVIDAGIGIPPELRERVFERFYRGAAGTTPGSGLGMSIVSRIVELHQAQVSMDNVDGGFRICVRFATKA